MKAFTTLTFAILTTASLSAQSEESGLFFAVYTDPSTGLEWTSQIPGRYSNGCVDSAGEPDHSKCSYMTLTNGDQEIAPQDSNAALACQQLGGRLPTLLEFHSLIRNFDHTEFPTTPSLTLTGRAQMQAVFKDMEEDTFVHFWTSTISAKAVQTVIKAKISVAWDFTPFIGRMGTAYRANSAWAVRCVRTN